MIAYLLNALASVFCAAALIWCVAVFWTAASDNHRRGMARVQRGTSWTPRVPEQRR